MDLQLKEQNELSFLYKYMLFYGNYNNNNIKLNDPSKEILFLKIENGRIMIETFDNLDCDHLCFPLYINDNHFEEINNKIKYFIHHFCDETEAINTFKKFMKIVLKNIHKKINIMLQDPNIHVNVSMISYKLTEDIYIYYQLYRIMHEYMEFISDIVPDSSYVTVINNILFHDSFMEYDRLNGYPNDLVVLNIGYHLLYYQSTRYKIISNDSIMGNKKNNKNIYDYYEESSELSSDESDINIYDIINNF